MPECVNVMTDLGNFYQDFNDFYVDYETMCENIDLINESTKDINFGLIKLEQIHLPVFKQAELDGKSVKKVMDEIYTVDKSLKAEYDEIKLQQIQKKQQAEMIKPSETWRYIPIAKWVLYDPKIKKVNELLKESEQLDQEKSVRQTKINNINKIFANVDFYLIPSLQAYLKCLFNLQDYLLKFHQ